MSIKALWRKRTCPRSAWHGKRPILEIRDHILRSVAVLLFNGVITPGKTHWRQKYLNFVKPIVQTDFDQSYPSDRVPKCKNSTRQMIIVQNLLSEVDRKPQKKFLVVIH